MALAQNYAHVIDWHLLMGLCAVTVFASFLPDLDRD